MLPPSAPRLKTITPQPMWVSGKAQSVFIFQQQSIFLKEDLVVTSYPNVFKVYSCHLAGGNTQAGVPVGTHWGTSFLTLGQKLPNSPWSSYVSRVKQHGVLCFSGKTLWRTPVPRTGILATSSVSKASKYTVYFRRSRRVVSRPP